MNRLGSLPRAILALGITSLLMDASSELIHSLMPLVMTSLLGASVGLLGLLEGLAESTAQLTKFFSGRLSDRLGKRKLLTVAGYGLSALSKPLFPLAPTLSLIFVARFIDRIGKGIRGAPRDALISDITPQEMRGAAFGLRQSLDSAGAVIGPLAAVGLLALLDNDLRSVMWLATIPAVLAVWVLIKGVDEPQSISPHSHTISRGNLLAVHQLSAPLWRIIIIGSIFTLARFSEAFLILRAQNIGMSLGTIPLVMVVMSLTYALGAYPAGSAADRYSHRTLLILGLCTLILSDLTLARASNISAVMMGAALWGLHMALTQGLLSKLIADTAPLELRGTAFGVAALIQGCALLIASTVAGVLWQFIGPAATFYAGTLFAALAICGLWLEAYIQK